MASQIVGIFHAEDVPTVAFEAQGDVLGERQIGFAFDRDLVVVVHPDEVRELQVAGDRSGFARDAFHQVAVAAQDVRLGVEELKARLVVTGREPLLGDRHADAISATLAERTGRGFHAAGFAEFRMSGAAAMQLAKLLDVLQRHGRLVDDVAVVIGLLHFREVQHAVEQHRSVAAGEHEAIAGRPRRVGGIEAEEVLPNGVGDGSQRHRRAGVSAVGGLHGVHRQGADRVDGQVLNAHGGRNFRRHDGFRGLRRAGFVDRHSGFRRWPARPTARLCKMGNKYDTGADLGRRHRGKHPASGGCPGTNGKTGAARGKNYAGQGP